MYFYRRWCRLTPFGFPTRQTGEQSGRRLKWSVRFKRNAFGIPASASQVLIQANIKMSETRATNNRLKNLAIIFSMANPILPLSNQY